MSHIAVEDHYSRIFVVEKEGIREIFVKIALKEILEQLPCGLFVQIHRSHVINLSYVSSIKRKNRSHHLVLCDGKYRLPLSRYRLAQVLPTVEGYRQILNDRIL